MNEGFATLFEFHITDILYPEWRARDFFNLDRLQIALKVEPYGALNAMTTRIDTLAEISNSFGFIAYNKAGSVLRMFQNAVGEDLFRDALRLYIKTNNYLAVTSDALMDALETVLEENSFNSFNFTAAFRTWELQAGYPLLHVSYDNDLREFHITQDKYVVRPDINDSKWFIPLNFATARSPDFGDTNITNFFESSEDMKIISTVTIPGFTKGDWFVFNKQQLNYYRVNYDLDNWNALIEVLNSENYNQIHVLNRAQLIDDALELAENEIIDLGDAINVLKYLRYETDYVPWAAAFHYLYTVDDVFGGTSLAFNQFMKQLSENVYNNFAVVNNVIPNDELLIEKYGRETAITWACKYGNEKCLREMNALVKSVANNNKTVPRGLESVIYCNGLRGLNKQPEWRNLWRKMQASSNEKERSLIIGSLGCSDDRQVLQDFLDSSLATNSDVNYTGTERLEVYNSVSSSSVGVQVAVEFLTKYEMEIISV